ncbi:MAG: DUF4062 domain-containing protein [bacterium]|nr:DUF4062 domain-containing protein [bacterium]
MKNRPPNVFVSSTMYDLNHLRSQLRRFIESLGWIAVMAEHGSFAIDVNQTTVNNSRRNVRENADVFVMIVGARYGSIDPGTDKSVTNLEFLEARARGIPTYVFVDSDVLAQLNVWQSNPDADYSGVVDTPRVFEFIDSFRGSGDVWTFPFATTESIIDTLREQFAYLVQDALALRQMAHGHDHLLEELTGDALMVALRRDELWEHRLFGTVLEAELDRRAPLRREVEYRLAQADVTHINIDDFGPWVLDRVHEFNEFKRTAKAISCDYLPQVQGDPIGIAAVARRFAQVWEDTARWTLRCRAVRVDPEAERVVDLLSTMNANMLDEIWEFGHSLIPSLDEAIEGHTDDDPLVFNMALTLTADVDELNEEIDRFGQRLSP